MTTSLLKQKAIKISLIAAMANDRVIGFDNKLPWTLPEDLKYFRHMTVGKPILMGRKTWESLPQPLAKRRNMVLSQKAGFFPKGGEKFATLHAALQSLAPGSELMVIGGGEIYRACLPYAERMYLTEIHAKFHGDTFFPEWAPNEWQEESRDRHFQAEHHWFYDFVCYQRIKSPAHLRVI